MQLVIMTKYVSYYEIGLIIDRLKKVYDKELTESEFKTEASIQLLEPSQEEKLYVSDQITITEVDNTVIRIYLDLKEKIDVVYFATLLESVLKDKEFKSNYVIFEIIIDNQTVDVFTVSKNLLTQFLTDFNAGATKVSKKEEQASKLFNNNDAALMFAIKLAVDESDGNMAFSNMITNTISAMKKDHKQSNFIADVISKVKSIFTNSQDNIIKQYKRYILALHSYLANRKYEANISSAITSYVKLLDPRDEYTYKEKFKFAEQMLKEKFNNIVYIESDGQGVSEDINDGNLNYYNNNYNRGNYNNRYNNYNNGYNNYNNRNNNNYNNSYNNNDNYDDYEHDNREDDDEEEEDYNDVNNNKPYRFYNKDYDYKKELKKNKGIKPYNDVNGYKVRNKEYDKDSYAKYRKRLNDAKKNKQENYSELDELRDILVISIAVLIILKLLSYTAAFNAVSYVLWAALLIAGIKIGFDFLRDKQKMINYYNKNNNRFNQKINNRRAYYLGQK